MKKEKKVEKNKVPYLIVAVIALIVLIAGVSYAVILFSQKSDQNSISTGTISMSYSEEVNGISLINALPLTDVSGVALTGNGEYFDFAVSTGTSRTLNVPYEINIIPGTITVDASNGALTNDQVKIYLSDQDENQIVEPTLISGLQKSTLRTGSLVLYTKANNPADANVVVDNYRLRIWIDGNVNAQSIADKKYSYSLKVNVNALVGAES